MDIKTWLDRSFKKNRCTISYESFLDGFDSLWVGTELANEFPDTYVLGAYYQAHRVS